MPISRRPLLRYRFGTLLCGLLCSASIASAQTWSAARKRPALWQIISVDATGERNWPYGAEDIAKDGEASFAMDEAGTDLRTSYADADADRIWIRSYVAAQVAPTADLVVFFFLDTDLRVSSGGSADASELWPAFQKDPSPGGYERVLGVRGDGRVLGYWQWNDKDRAFATQTIPSNKIRVEVGKDRDPIAIGAAERGYLQVEIDHTLSELDVNCRTQVFVRAWNDVMGREFGDDDVGPAACRPAENDRGDPVVLHSDVCRIDDECPAGGRCREGVCLFAYACDSNPDCRDGERCDSGTCVRVVDGSCSSASQCDGLLCDSGRCVACSDAGTRACKLGQLCSPNGSCFSVSDVRRGAPAGEGGVRGGAFHCAAAASSHGAPRGGGWVVWLLALSVWRAHARRKRRDPSVAPTKGGAP